MSRLLVTTIVLLAAVAAAGEVRAAPLPVRATGIDRENGRVCASVGMQDLFSEADRQRIRSGFATRVLVRIALYREGSSEPVARTYLRSEIVYDIWDEKFRVRSTSPEYVERRTETTVLDEAVQRATALWHFPVAPLALLEPEARYYLAVRADLNPISEQEMADIRRWLAAPRQSAARRVEPGESLFGSFVSVFINPRVDESERQVRFMSQVFTEPRRVLP